MKLFSCALLEYTENLQVYMQQKVNKISQTVSYIYIVQQTSDSVSKLYNIACNKL